MKYERYFKKPIRDGVIELPKRSLETFLKNRNYARIRCVRDSNLHYIEVSSISSMNFYFVSNLLVEKQISPWYIKKIEEKKIKIQKELLYIMGINTYAACVHVGNYSLISNLEEFLKKRNEFEKEEKKSFYWLLS